MFMSNAQISKQLGTLRTKLLRQQATVEQTELEIAHWDDQLELNKHSAKDEAELAATRAETKEAPKK